MRTRILIADKDAAARLRLAQLLSRLGNAVIVEACKGAIQTMEALLNKDVDLMFLDEELDEMSGLDFLASLSFPPEVILTASSSANAQMGFELDALAYLTKPLSFHGITKALGKYYQRVQAEQAGGHSSTIPEHAFLHVKERDRTVRLQVKDICFIEVLGGQVRIHSRDRLVLTRAGIHSLEQALTPWPFLRIHNNTLISLPWIESFSANEVEIKNTSLAVGRAYRDQLFYALGYCQLKVPPPGSGCHQFAPAPPARSHVPLSE